MSNISSGDHFKLARTSGRMVLISEGSSEHVAHVGTETGNHDLCQEFVLIDSRRYLNYFLMALNTQETYCELPSYLSTIGGRIYCVTQFGATTFQIENLQQFNSITSMRESKRTH